MVEVTLGRGTLEPEMTTTATAVLRDAAGNVLTGRPVGWQTGSAAVATVTGAGLVTAVGPGRTFVRATAEQAAGQADLEVIAPVVATVTVSPGQASLTRGKAQALTAVLRTTLGNPISRPVAWTSSATAVATVSDQGLVTAIGLGQAIITASSDGRSGAATVAVVPFSFGAGTRVVGAEVPPGLYRSANPASAFCYWERLRGFGGTTAEIIANDIGGGPRLATIAPTDIGFRSSGCATWIEAVEPVTSSPEAPFGGDGVYLVGMDVAQGLWRSVTPPPSSGCYWARLSGFGGSSDELLANDIGGGPRLAAIGPGDAGFATSRCGAWQRVTGPVTTSPTADFGEGVFLVGTDVAPGTWRSTGSGDSCYWERLRGFSGVSGDIIANDFGPSPVIVTIAPTDLGFSSSRCGTWTRIN